MNFKTEPLHHSTSTHHAERLQDLIGEILQCCQERMLIESKTLDLPPAEIRCVMLFQNERYLTAGEISDRLDVGKSRVTKIVQGLNNKGLLKVLIDPNDGRIKLFGLTPEGKSKLDQIKQFLTAVHERVLSQMEPQQRTTVLAALELLRSSMYAVKEHFNTDNISSQQKLIQGGGKTPDRHKGGLT